MQFNSRIMKNKDDVLYKFNENLKHKEGKIPSNTKITK